MRGIQAGGDLRDDPCRSRRRERAVAAHERVQVGPVDVAHDEVQPAVLLARAVDGHDVRVVDRGRHPHLADEALGVRAVGDALRRDDLQRDAAVERELRRPVDDAHAAATGDRLDAAAGEALTGAQVVHATKCDRIEAPAAHSTE